MFPFLSRAGRCHPLILALLNATPGVAVAVDGIRIQTHGRLGLTTFVTAEDGGAIPLQRNALAAAGGPVDERVLFLEQHGAAFGIGDPATELRAVVTDVDELGWTHTTYAQLFRGLPVFSGVLKVHQNADGAVVSANGRFYPISEKLRTTPTLSPDDAEKRATADFGPADVFAETIELTLVDPGWYGDAPLGPQLAYHLVLVDPAGTIREAYFVDAHGGEVLDRWSLICDIRNRSIYDGNESSSLPGTLERSEGQPAVGDADIDQLYDYAGDTYDFFFRGFGRDSINGAGMTLVATGHSTFGGCSNARWNGAQTIFCTGLATDDVVGHEFVHGLTQFTAGLIYQNQSGQLNESFSDLFGELIDLFNGNAAFAGPPAGPSWPAHGSGPGGDTPNNLRSGCSPSPANADGKRWLVGEDIAGTTITGAIRDMWDPTCRNHPDRANSSFQTCNPNDAGGVHSGSGVPNHAFAILTDGKSFNSITTTGIGPIKAGAVWYRALTAYLTPASDFEDAYLALNQAAADLVGTTPLDPRTGLSSGSAFTAADAVQVDNALRAVEMNTPGACGQGDDVLAAGAAVLCANRSLVFSDAFEGGVNGWTVANSAPPTPYDWVQRSTALPFGRSGTVWFCADPSIGTCSGASIEAGRHTLTSPAVVLPPGANFPYIRFTHYAATEGNWDGGNVKVRVNGGAWQLVPRNAFTSNPYNGRINTVAQGNDNPLAGEGGFTGAGGVWGTSVADLSGFAGGGDTVQVRFDFGKDGCTGVTGWFVDDFELFDCPDCDSNGQADARAFHFNAASEALGNIGSGSPQAFTIPSPPAAGGVVTLTLQAMGDFSSAGEFINVDVNGTDAGDVFVTDASDCGHTPDRQSLTMSAAAWNAAVGGGSATINLVATGDVNPTISSAHCAGSTYVSVAVRYPRSTPDANGNGVPDACEALSVDAGADRTVNEGALLVLLAAFSDPLGGLHTGSVDWGDGSASPATVDEGGQTVSASHHYADNGVYTATVTVQQAARIATDSVSVTVFNVAPTVAAGPNRTVNVGTPLSLPPATFSDPGFDSPGAGTSEDFSGTVNWGDGTGDQPLTIIETPGDAGVPTMGTAAASHTYATPGQREVIVTVMDDDGGATSDSFMVTVEDCVAGFPQVTQQPVGQAVCPGGSVTFTVAAAGNAPLSYQWQRNSVDLPGATGAAYTDSEVQPGDAGAYRCVVSNACGAVNSDDATLTVDAGPAIDTHPTNQTVCGGEPVTFTVAADGTAPLAYQWRKDADAIAGATGSSYSIPSAAAGDAGSYDVVVSNACGSVTSAAATLSVHAGPNITEHPAGQDVCPGAGVTFSVAADGTGPLAYQWRKDADAIAGATGSSYSIPSAAAGDAGSYDVVVSNACGSATSSAAGLTVGAGPQITQSPEAATRCPGEAVTFSVSAAGTAPLAYQWRKGGDEIGGATADSFTIAAVTTGDAGSYDVVVSNDCGAATSAAATLTITACGGPGDMNCDGTVDFFDIDPFLLALFSPAAYDAQFPECDRMNGDLDDSGGLDFFDIDPFLECLFDDICG